MNGRRLYENLVTRLAVEVPLFAKALVDDALARHKLDPVSATPFQLKRVVDADIAPRVARILETSQSPHVSTFGGGLIQIGRDGTVLQINPSARKMLGISPMLSGSELFERLVGLDAVRHPTDFERQGRRVSAWRIERSGRLIQCHGAAAVSARLPSEIASITVTLLDVTLEQELEDAMGEVFERLEARNSELAETSEQMRELAEQAQAANEAKSRFLATMSHEIRTPLTAVIGMTNLLLETELTDEQRELAETTERSARVLLSLINAVLDLSRLEAGRVEVERIPFDLQVVVGEAAGVVESRASTKGLTLDWKVQEDVPVRLVGDPIRLRQVLLNLLDNAVKFTARGGVALSVERVEDAERIALRFEVKDSGIGIAPDRLEQLFEPFTQADASTTRRYGGSGLGLAICRRIVERLGGRLVATSAEGDGTTFSFTLAFDETSEPVPGPTTSIRSSIPKRKRTGRVLVAEDNPVNQIVIRKMLELRGLDVSVVGNGQEAVDALVEPFDLVFMDCQMPVMDGFDATRAIRASRAVCDPKIPIVALTATAISGSRTRCLEVGMSDFLLKPIDPGVLTAVIDRWLSTPVDS